MLLSYSKWSYLWCSLFTTEIRPIVVNSIYILNVYMKYQSIFLIQFTLLTNVTIQNQNIFINMILCCSLGIILFEFTKQKYLEH